MCYWYVAMVLIINRKTTAVMDSNEVGQQSKKVSIFVRVSTEPSYFCLDFFLSVVDNVHASFAVDRCEHILFYTSRRKLHASSNLPTR